MGGEFDDPLWCELGLVDSGHDLAAIRDAASYEPGPHTRVAWTHA